MSPRFLTFLFVLLLGNGVGQEPTRTVAHDLFTLATTGSREEVDTALRATDLDPDVRDTYGQTPLMYAVDHDNHAAAEALLHEGADPNARSLAGWTPLMYATRLPHHEAWSLATLLLRFGADPGLANGSGHTAIDLAQEAGQDDLARLLEAAAPIHDALRPKHLGWLTTLTTPTGRYSAAIVDHLDAIVVRSRAGGSHVTLRISEHRGFRDLLEDLELDWRYGLTRLTLDDVDGDAHPDLLISGGCECETYTFDVLVDGASGWALAVESLPFGDIAPARNRYRYPPDAPTWMRHYLAGALAARYPARVTPGAGTFERRVRYVAP